MKLNFKKFPCIRLPVSRIPDSRRLPVSWMPDSRQNLIIIFINMNYYLKIGTTEICDYPVSRTPGICKHEYFLQLSGIRDTGNRRLSGVPDAR